MPNRITSLILCLFITFGGCAHVAVNDTRTVALEQQSDGIWGLKWGTPKRELTGLALVNTEGRVEVYKAVNLAVKVDSTTFNNVFLGFCMDTLCAAKLAFNDPVDGTVLRNAVVKLYGPPDEFAERPQEGDVYIWRRNNLEISLVTGREGALQYRYEPGFRQE